MQIHSKVRVLGKAEQCCKKTDMLRKIEAGERTFWWQVHVPRNIRRQSMPTVGKQQWVVICRKACVVMMLWSYFE